MHEVLKRSTNVGYICCAALLAGISVCTAAPPRGIVSSAEEGHMEGVLVTATAKSAWHQRVWPAQNTVPRSAGLSSPVSGDSFRKAAAS
jgi:hypothetical protein